MSGNLVSPNQRPRFRLFGIQDYWMRLRSNGGTGRLLAPGTGSTGRMLTRISAPKVFCGALQLPAQSPAFGSQPPNCRNL